MFLRLLTLALALPVVLTFACDSGGGEEGETPSAAVCPEDSTLTWETFGEAFMTAYCTRCHGSNVPAAMRNGAPSDHNFDTLEGVREEMEHIDYEAAAGPEVVNTAMPIGGPAPTEDERRKLGEWLACDAP